MQALGAGVQEPLPEAARVKLPASHAAEIEAGMRWMEDGEELSSSELSPSYRPDYARRSKRSVRTKTALAQKRLWLNGLFAPMFAAKPRGAGVSHFRVSFGVHCFSDWARAGQVVLLLIVQCKVPQERLQKNPQEWT